jgi:hypothetical protein
MARKTACGWTMSQTHAARKLMAFKKKGLAKPARRERKHESPSLFYPQIDARLAH